MTSREVPSARCWSLPSVSTMNGTMTRPPPTPNSADRTPVNIPNATTPTETHALTSTSHHQKLDADGDHQHAEHDLQRALLGPRHDAGAERSTDQGAQREKSRDLEVDLAVERERERTDRPDRHDGRERRGVGLVLAQVDQRDQQGNNDDSTPHAEETAQDSRDQSHAGGRSRNLEGTETHVDASSRAIRPMPSSKSSSPRA